MHGKGIGTDWKDGKRVRRENERDETKREEKQIR